MEGSEAAEAVMEVAKVEMVRLVGLVDRKAAAVDMREGMDSKAGEVVEQESGTRRLCR